MLKLYTDSQFLSETHRKEVFPLLFDIHFRRSEFLSTYYSLVNAISTCDIVVFPIDYVVFVKKNESFNSLYQAAKQNNKPIWIYSAGDFGFTNYLPNSYTFRLGGFKSKLEANTFILPSFINDPYLTEIPQGFSVLKKEDKPSIGFVGHAQTGLNKMMKEVIGYFKITTKQYLKRLLSDKQPFYPSSIKRAIYLKQLTNDRDLNTNFILRKSYKGGVTLKADKQKSKTEFYDNVFNNAYTFCSRGVGNFSVRFYETLAMGRIPIVLNTDCKFPLETEIDWSKHCIIIDEKDVGNMTKVIKKFHENISVYDFENLQYMNRYLWESKLMRHQYFTVIHDLFINKLTGNE